MSPVPRDRSAYVRCRDLGHSWDNTTPSRLPRNQHEVIRAVHCTNCGMVRNDRLQIVTQNGTWTKADLVGRAYDQPPNYRQPKRSKAEWRVEFLNLKSPARPNAKAPHNPTAEKRRAAIAHAKPIDKENAAWQSTSMN